MPLNPAEIPGGTGAKGAADAAAAPPSGTEPGPISSPMSTPQPNEGLRQNARTQVQIARQQLEGALPALGSDSDEGRAVLDCLKKLSSAFGKTETKDRELIPAEIASLVSGMPGGAPAQKPTAGAPAPAMA